MTNVKKAALGLKAKPSQVADVCFEKKDTTSKMGCFKFRTPAHDSITILKNKDYDKLPF